MRDRLLLWTGGGLAAAGLAAAWTGATVALPGVDRPVVTLVGIGALVWGAAVAAERYDGSVGAADTAEPERPAPVAVPGERFLGTLRRARYRQATGARDRVRERLRGATVAVVRRRRGCSRGRAAELVDTGAWTEDPHAAALLSDERGPRAPELSTLARLRTDSAFVFRAGRAVGELLDAGGVSPDRAGNGWRPSTVDRPSPDGAAAAEQVGGGRARAAADAGDPGADVLRSTGRWRGLAGLALATGGAGVLLGRPSVVVVAAVGVGCVAYAAAGTAPDLDARVERDLSAEEPSPGDAVEVTLKVTNEGDGPLWDLRVVDAVPPGLAVTEGTPRLGTSLRPGATATVTYAVEATRGAHEFGPVRVLARGLAGAAEWETTASAPATLTCVPPLAGSGTVPMRGATSRFTGRVTTDEGGDGVEFYATREYRPGDPPGRIDWNRHARTRELATLLFRPERAATVVLLIDARAAAVRAGDPTGPTAVDHAVTAAVDLFAGLSTAGDRVGVAGFGPRGGWLAPGAGAGHREAARRLLATHPSFARRPPDERFALRRRLATVRGRLPVDARFVFLTPALDDAVVPVARRLQAHGHPVSVVSPDVTAADGLAGGLARLERRLRLGELREGGIHVLDWDPATPLSVAVDRAAARWSR